MSPFDRLFHFPAKSDRCKKPDRLERDPAFVAKFPRQLPPRQQDPWRVDFWRGSLSRTEGDGIKHMIAASHLRKVEGSQRVDRRSPHSSDKFATHEFFILFTVPHSQERKLVWRSQHDLGHKLLASAQGELAAAQARYAALKVKENTSSGEGLQAVDRALKAMGKARSNLRAAEVQIDICARSVCEAIALEMESAAVHLLLRQDKESESHWGDVAAFSALQCDWQKSQSKKKPLGSGVVRGVILD